ncbi:MAG: hypothetical protein J6R29_00270 [Clostridia bacterium]|nr:hypothetical protein [Clostridia bacterium]
MIKYETIISNFDDKVTLYNWLRKVEEALKNASATNFVVNKKGNATLSFSITFADGTTLESGDIVLQQGESVDGARIASGILQLHLTNGTWLTAGNLGAVSGFSINASQHLIVTYQDGTTQDLGAIFNGNITISGDLAVTGDTNVSGTINANKVTGNEIIETMVGGYSFDVGTPVQMTYDLQYAGACKNGNKITFVIAGTIKRTSSAYTVTLGSFTIPSEIGDKLYPTIGSVLEYKNAYCAKDQSTGVTLPLNVIKNSNTSLTFRLDNAIELTLNQVYFIRAEVTFLLSTNLLGE